MIAPALGSASAARRGRATAITLALVICLGAGPAAYGADATITFDEALLNEMSAAIVPLTASGSFPFGPGPIVLCDLWSITLETISFEIRSPGAAITAEIAGSYGCLGTEVPLDAAIATSAVVAYDADLEAVTLSPKPAILTPCFSLPGWIPFLAGINVCVPLAIDPAPMLTFTLPIRTGSLELESPNGPIVRRVTPRDLEVKVEDGRIELHTDVAIW